MDYRLPLLAKRLKKDKIGLSNIKPVYEIESVGIQDFSEEGRLNGNLSKRGLRVSSVFVNEGC